MQRRLSETNSSRELQQNSAQESGDRRLTIFVFSSRARLSTKPGIERKFPA
jgi:hypothetical protein